MKSFAKLPTFDPASGDALAVIEAPKGSRNKYGYNNTFDVFDLHKVLPHGMIFPYDFGFIPGTKGEDDDPLDILLLLDDPAPMGCVIRTRVWSDRGGTVRRRQKMDRERPAHRRGDACPAARNVKNLKELNACLLDEMEAFFTQYNQMQGKQFRAKDRSGPKRAEKLIEKGRTAFTNA